MCVSMRFSMVALSSGIGRMLALKQQLIEAEEAERASSSRHRGNGVASKTWRRWKCLRP